MRGRVACRLTNDLLWASAGCNGIVPGRPGACEHMDSPGPRPDDTRESTKVATRKSDRRSSPRRAEYIVIECVTPQLDGGRHPVKRTVGDRVSVGADLVHAGHDTLGAQVLYRGPAAGGKG